MNSKITVGRRDGDGAPGAALLALFLVCLAVVPFFAIFPELNDLLFPALIALIASGGLLVATSGGARRSSVATTASHDTGSQVPIDTPEQSRRAASRPAATVAGVLALLAVLGAVGLFDWRLVLAVSVFALAGLARFCFPAWFPAATDATRDEAARHPGRPGLQP